MITRHKKTSRLAIRLIAVAFAFSFVGFYTVGQGVMTRNSIVYADPAEGGGETGPAVPEKLEDTLHGTRKNDCKELNENDCGIIKIIRIAINVLSAVAVLTIVIAVIVGGIQYTSSRDDPQAIAAAKGRIVNALIALVVFVFFYTILAWLVPGLKGAVL